MERVIIDCATGETATAALTAEEIAARELQAVPRVPRSVTKLQLVRALRAAGLKASFDTALTSATAETQEDWDLAVSIRRDDPLVASFAATLGQTEAQVDDLFRQAGAL